jgi:hypothetical protein
MELPDFARRKPAWPSVTVSLAVVTAYLGIALFKEGPIQVWLMILAPFALVSVATALRIIDPSEGD